MLCTTKHLRYWSNRKQMNEIDNLKLMSVKSVLSCPTVIVIIIAHVHYAVITIE